MRADARAFFDAAVTAVDPARLVAGCLGRDGDAVCVHAAGELLATWRGPTTVAGAGKAAARMAAGCEAALGPGRLRGRVIVADGCGVPLEAVAVEEAGHPLPDERGIAATGRVLAEVAATRAGVVLCLIGGGASSLLVAPRPPLTLADKVAVTRALLSCGAAIGEISIVRRHLSLVKGGGLLRRASQPVIALLLSDVPGDDPATIGSGPTVPDPSTFADALEVLERYRAVEGVPPAVVRFLRAGAAGAQEETLKPGAPEAARARHAVIGSNRAALEGAAAAARRAGYEVRVETAVLTGDTTEAARSFGRRLLAALAAPRPQPLCILAGGETTVRVRGPGRGGRNQEFALVLAEQLAGRPVVVLSAGTDGIDGPTPAAGAVVDGGTLGRARERGLDPGAALAANDSFTFFEALGDLVVCGPTGTNVMDVKVALLPAGPGGDSGDGR